MSETADAIMDAAARRIRTAGYNGFSFREINTDVGVKSASAHCHFATKESLAPSVARRYTERLMSSVDQDIAEGRELIEAWTLAFRRALQDDEQMYLCGALGAASAQSSRRDRHRGATVHSARFGEAEQRRIVISSKPRKSSPYWKAPCCWRMSWLDRSVG